MSSFTPENFDATRLTVDEPKHGNKAGNDFITMSIKYGGGQFNFFENHPVTMTRISENPKKKDGLSQGVRLENEAFKKLAIDASRIILEAVVTYRNHPVIAQYAPFVKNFDSVEKIMQAKAFGLKVKTLVHFVEKKDNAGKGTGQADTEIAPLMYGKLIQSGPNPSDPKTAPNTIFTKHWSAGILDPTNDALIKARRAKEEDFKFDPRKVFASQSGMKGMPGVNVGDVYIAQGNLIIRTSITEVFITEWVTGESMVKKGLMEEIKKSGIKVEGPMALPDAPAPPLNERIEHPAGPVQPGGVGPTEANVQNVGFSNDGEFTVTVK